MSLNISISIFLLRAVYTFTHKNLTCFISLYNLLVTFYNYIFILLFIVGTIYFILYTIFILLFIVGSIRFIWNLQLQDTDTSIYHIRPMAYGHSLTKYFILHYIFYFIYTDLN